MESKKNDKSCASYDFTAIEKIEVIHILIYPNPASDLINFQLPEGWVNKEYELTITDIAGRIIKTVKRNESNLSVSVNELSDGIYFAVFKSQDGASGNVNFVVNK